MTAWRGFLLAAIATSPALLWYASSIVRAAHPCNTQSLDDASFQACATGYAAEAFCVNWGQNDCKTEQGADSTSAGPSWKRACTPPEPNHVNNDCSIRDRKCKQKFMCRWDDDTMSCIAGAPLDPESWYLQDEAYSADCTPT